MSTRSCHVLILLVELVGVRRRDVGRVLAFQPGGPGSIPDWVRNFNLYPGTGSRPLSVFCPPMLSLMVVLTTDFRKARPCVFV